MQTINKPNQLNKQKTCGNLEYISTLISIYVETDACLLQRVPLRPAELNERLTSCTWEYFHLICLNTGLPPPGDVAIWGVQWAKVAL